MSIDAALPLTLPAGDRVAVTLTARGGVGAYTFEVVRGGAGLAFTATTSLAIDGRALWKDALARMDRWSPMTFGFEPGAPVEGPSFDIAGYARSTYADALGTSLADALVPVLVPIEIAVADANGARDTLTQWLVVLGPREEFDSLLARKRREAAALAPGDEGQR